MQYLQEINCLKPELLHLQQLLQKDVLTAEEKQWLLTYLQDNGTPELYYLLKQTFKEDLATGKKIDDAISVRMRKRLLSEVQLSGQVPLSAGQPSSGKRPVGSRTVLLMRTRWAAAVVLLVVSGLAIYRALIEGRAPNIPAQRELAVVKEAANVIVPGGNKAVLTLSNGSAIVLDSAHNGSLVNEKNAQVSKQDGKLSYAASPAAGTSAAMTYNVLTTPKGGQYQVVLQDGTRVWLNSASSLRYPTIFSGRDREVEMTGEAYFEVAKNKDKPFRVRINHRMQADVLGTDFNVMAYEEEPSVNTTLVNGSVRLVKDGANVLLKPGQQGSLRSADFKVSEANVENNLAWKNGLFQLDNSNIETIMRQVARWYDVDISYRGNLRDQVYYGSMPRKENISELLKLLEYTGTVHFIIEGRKVIVTK